MRYRSLGAVSPRPSQFRGRARRQRMCLRLADVTVVVVDADDVGPAHSGDLSRPKVVEPTERGRAAGAGGDELVQVERLESVLQAFAGGLLEAGD